MSLARIHRESAEGLYRSPAQVNVRAEDGRRVTVHGFRATFKDWCEDENNFPSNHVEECLSHAVGNKTEQAYRRPYCSEETAHHHGKVGALLRVRIADRPVEGGK